LGIGGISGNELLFFVLPLLVIFAFVARLGGSVIKAVRGIADSLASISRSLAKIASRPD
jgi:hypothetical protein